MGTLRTLNDVAISSTDNWPKSSPDFTEYSSVLQHSPMSWHGGMVQSFNFQVGFNASSPSKLSVRLIEDANNVLNTSDFTMGNFLWCPVGTYNWYGIVQSLDREMDARSTEDGVVGIPTTFVTMESFRCVMDTVQCVLSQAGVIINQQESNLSNILNVYKLAYDDQSIQYSGYYKWRDDLGMPWNTFKKSLESPSAKFIYKNKTFRIVWDVQKNSTFDSWDSNLWYNNEVCGLAEAIEGYVSQRNAVWIDEIEQSKIDGIDYDLNIHIYERTTDSYVEQKDVTLLCNSSDILYNFDKINNICNITWGTENRRDPTRHTILGAPVEFMQKYDTKNFIHPNIVVPNSDVDIKNYYGLNQNQRYIFPYFGIHDIDTCGIPIDVLNKEQNSYKKRYLATQPYITKYCENAGFYLNGVLSIKNYEVPKSNYWFVSASSPTDNAGSNKGNLYIDGLFYYLMVGNCRDMAGLYNFYFDCMTPSINGNTWSYNYQGGLINCNINVKNTLEKIWEYIHEPIGGFIYGGRIKTRGDTAEYSKTPNEMDACHELANYIQSLPDMVDFTNANETVKEAFYRSDGSMYIMETTQYNLWQTYCRLKHIAAEFDRLAGEFLNNWIAVMPQSVSISRKDRHMSEWSSDLIYDDKYYPNKKSYNGSSLEIFDCYATNAAWPFTKIDGNPSLPDDGDLNVPIYPKDIKSDYFYDLGILWEQDFLDQKILWGALDPSTFKIPALAIWSVEPNKTYTYTAEGDMLVQDNSLKADKCVKYASTISIGEPVWILKTAYDKWQLASAGANNYTIIPKIQTGMTNACIAKEYFSLNPFTLGGRLSYRDAWFAPNIGPNIGTTLDNLDGTFNYKPIPAEIYIPFVYKYMRYGPYTNLTPLEEQSNEYTDSLKIEEQFSPWGLGGDIEMYKNIEWYLNQQKTNLTKLDRFQIQAFDCFRPLSTTNTNNKNVRFRPGLNIMESCDTLMTDLVAEFSENGWSFTANFASYVRKPSQMGQRNFDTLYRLQKSAEVTRRFVDVQQKQMNERLQNAMPYSNYFAGLKTIDKFIGTLSSKITGAGGNPCFITFKNGNNG